MTMLDLCSGFGGASEAMKRNDWQVTRLDIEPRVNPDIIADLRALPLAANVSPTLLWASPPCTEYSRYDQRDSLFPGEPEPSLELWQAAEAAIELLRPRYWIIENVRGAVRFHGPATYRFGPYHLWTNIPFMVQPSWTHVPKYSLCSGDDPLHSAKRGYIPYAISDAVRLSIEAQMKE